MRFGCPLVIESLETDVNAKSEQGHRFFYICLSPIEKQTKDISAVWPRVRAQKA